MLETSSRIHTFVYSALLTIVLICLTVHLADFIGAHYVDEGANTLIYISLIVSSVLAPPASFLLAFSSHRLIKVQEQLHALATTDPLTGLLNRRAFENHYQKESARYARTGEPLSILVLDLDRFKHVNNLHGHIGGDVALKALAECLRASMRYGTDEVARWGGEEFTVLLSNSGRDSAVRAALRYRKAIETLNIPFEGKKIRLTASFGITVCQRGETLQDAVARADVCLREAKRQGRNQVVTLPADTQSVEASGDAASEAA